MKAVTSARLIDREGQTVRFAADFGATLTITVLEPTVFRVTLLKPAGWRLDRTWSIAPGGLEPPFEGRSREDLTGFSCPEFSVEQREGRVTIASEALIAEVTVAPLGIGW